jgi:hypothetical protein
MSGNSRSGVSCGMLGEWEILALAKDSYGFSGRRLSIYNLIYLFTRKARRRLLDAEFILLCGILAERPAGLRLV